MHYRDLEPNFDLLDLGMRSWALQPNNRRYTTDGLLLVQAW